LVLNHDDVIWDCPKMGVMEEKKFILKHTILGRLRIVIGILL